jgi:hypothetical protein
MKYVFAGFGVLLLILGLSWVFTGNDFFLYKYWAPKQENVRRQVFENTQSYVQGKIQNLEQQCFAYQSADGAQKKALAGEIRNEASTIDLGKLPTDEQSCVSEARGQ